MIKDIWIFVVWKIEKKNWITPRKPKIKTTRNEMADIETEEVKNLVSQRVDFIEMHMF